MRKNESGDDGVRRGERRVSRLDRWGRYRVDENRRRRIFARDQSRGGIFWRSTWYGPENQSERDGCVTQEHAVYERGHDFGSGTVVGRNRQRTAHRVNQLEGRGVGSFQGSGGASECAGHRVCETVAEQFSEVGGAGRGSDFSVFIWRTAGPRGATGV